MFEFLHLLVRVALFHCMMLAAAVARAVIRLRVSEMCSAGWCRNLICPTDITVEVSEDGMTLVWWAGKEFVDG